MRWRNVADASPRRRSTRGEMAIAAARNRWIGTGLDWLGIRAILRIAGFFGGQIRSLVALSCCARP